MIKNLIKRKLVVTAPDSKVSDVAKIMEREDVGCVLVLEEDRPRGLITDRDIVLRCVAKNIDVDDCTVENIMTESLQTVHENDGIFDCIETMKEAGVRRIPVVNDAGEAVGVVSFGDLLNVVSQELAELTCSTTPTVSHEERRAA